MRSKFFPDRCRELVFFPGEKRLGYEAVGEDWYQLDIHQFNQLREGERKRGEVYEVAAQFRVYLVSELRGVLIVVDVNSQVSEPPKWRSVSENIFATSLVSVARVLSERLREIGA